MVRWQAVESPRVRRINVESWRARDNSNSDDTNQSHTEKSISEIFRGIFVKHLEFPKPPLTSRRRNRASPSVTLSLSASLSSVCELLIRGIFFGPIPFTSYRFFTALYSIWSFFLPSMLESFQVFELRPRWFWSSLFFSAALHLFHLSTCCS